jgi:hypothetical protein
MSPAQLLKGGTRIKSGYDGKKEGKTGKVIAHEIKSQYGGLFKSTINMNRERKDGADTHH